MSTTQTPSDLIGQSVPRLDSYEKVTGAAIYENDIRGGQMVTVVDKNAITQATPLSLVFHLDTTLNINADQARTIVNRQVVTELGTGLSAGEAELLIGGNRIRWRVPIILSLPDLGHLGQAGAIEVDSQTGHILTAPEIRTQIIKYASIIYHGATLQTE
ncbi:MAG TPA: hypothetical protein G4N96_08265 [Chloroflexi bacterium]|nr:hypothetical protein [Chloroflexota bacterium]